MTTSKDKLTALINYIEEREDAEMVSLDDGYIMVKKTQNNCIHKGTNHTKYCPSGVNCVCPKWELKEI